MRTRPHRHAGRPVPHPARRHLPAPAGTMEEKAGSWLLGELPRTLVDPGRLARFEQFIRTLLPL
ncbi:hypothetical protein KBB96_13615 [Luteolibacter ambystomatis]|uniref:Uncharacterized protein n=1 Tax=Luteolibacter ambystomatis TaxID=2824561 RepID=A0A975G5W0_9BACT|nr:hypothetical protein [Luteolibacter ambystomatis]QUE49902.1 hypothetical protein KBB96_13615 [Luteolibacter ambystomatis]